jgi:hypothetical protein
MEKCSLQTSRKIEMQHLSLMKRTLLGSSMAAAVLVLAACGGGDGSSAASNSDVRVKQIAVPGVNSANQYSFDLGTVDSASGTYYVTNRTSQSVDVIDIATLTVKTQFKPGFAGCYNNSGAFAPSCGTVNGVGINNDASGPNGIDIVGANLYVGDVNKIWVLDKSTGAVVSSVAIPSNPVGLRADEGCFDSVDNIYAISTPGDNNPFMTFFDTSNPNAPKIIARLVMNNADGTNSQGLEACVFDKTTKAFFVNNDGSTSNPHGEMDVIPVASIIALKATAPSTVGNVGGWRTAIAGSKVFTLPALCDPTGIDVGPGNSIGAMCRPGTVGTRLDFVILDKVTGATTTTVAGAGGGDQITYNAETNRWYLGDSRATANGLSCGGGSAACVLTPKLTVVDGTTGTVIKSLDAGNNAHSVAVGGGYVFSPYTKASATGGGAGFDTNGTGSGGISAVSTLQF